jgi:hypothetical protein
METLDKGPTNLSRASAHPRGRERCSRSSGSPWPNLADAAVHEGNIHDSVVALAEVGVYSRGHANLRQGKTPLCSLAAPQFDFAQGKEELRKGGMMNDE